MAYHGFTYSYEYGTVRETTFHIGVRLDPSINDVADFPAVLFFELPTGEVVHVAKIDNSDRHDGRAHIHRYYRTTGTNERDFEIDVESWEDAEELLTTHAEDWVLRYLDAHGRTPHTE